MNLVKIHTWIHQTSRLTPVRYPLGLYQAGLLYHATDSSVEAARGVPSWQ